MPPVPEAAPLTPPAPNLRFAGTLLRLLRQDTGIVVGTVVASNLLRVFSSIILTRLLAPEAFGVVGVIMSVSFVLIMISDLGFQAFVVRHPDGDAAGFRDAIWSVRLIRAILLTLALLVLAEPIANALQKPQLATMIAASSALFLLEGLSSLALITALRDRLLLRLSLLELAIAVVQLLASVALALLWRNAWAIIVALLLASAAKAWMSYVIFPEAKRRWRLDRHYNAQLWGFARFVTGSSVITMLLLQADKVVLSRFLSLETLGLYVLAGNLAMAPLAFTAAYASRVLYPLYARTWRDDPAALAGIYYAARRHASLLYMLGAGGLIGVAPLLIAILYDDRYADAATYLRLLAITPMLALGSAAANEALTASGRVEVTFHASLVKLLWLAIAGPAGFIAFGPIGLIVAVAVMEAPNLIYCWFALARAGIFRMTEELLLLAAGAGGIVAGMAASVLLMPALGHPG